MKQPERVMITPSNPSPWYGEWGEHRFSTQQRGELVRMGLDPDTAEAIAVKRSATDREMWWPINSRPPTFEFDAPVIGRRKDGKVKIVSPAGHHVWIFGDGWAGPMGKIKKASFW